MNQPNLYGMYIASGHNAGFFVRRDSWAGSTYARVLTIGGQASGPLSGKSPYFGNPAVIVDFYFNDRLKESGMQLSCPGTYAYTQIPDPRSPST
jgi:hypothetical protein